VKVAIDIDFDTVSPTPHALRRMFENFLDKHYADEHFFYSVQVEGDEVGRTEEQPAQIACQVVEHDGVFRCVIHDRLWAAMFEPHDDCVAAGGGK
jgi:hypothetical protein